MDKIYTGILLSKNSNQFKVQFIERVILPYSLKPLSRKEYSNILHTSLNTIAISDVTTICAICKKVYLKYAENNHSSFSEYVMSIRLKDILVGNKSPICKNIFEIIHGTFKLLKNEKQLAELCSVFSENITEASLNMIKDVTTYKSLVTISKQYPGCWPSKNSDVFFETLICALVEFHPSSQNTSDLTAFVADITIICSFLKKIWSDTSQAELQKYLGIIYKILCRDKEPSLALAAVAQVFPIQKVDLSKFRIVEISSAVKEIQLENVLKRMINWLNWPISSNISPWILYMIQELVRQEMYDLLVRVSFDKIEMIADRLMIAFGRSGAFDVFSLILFSLHDSPEIFHKVLNHASKLLVLFKEDSVLMANFVELLYCMFQLHSGFPDLYESLLHAISDYPAPTSERIEKLTSCKKWNSKKSAQLNESLIQVSRKGKPRSSLGFVGLENLGNICYMNSIIQALFMSTEFVAAIMADKSQGSLSESLQYLFAFLIHSERMSFSPSSFLAAAKPPWFESGDQQDCSEFLHYLLNALHEQSKTKKKEQSIVEKLFFGKLESSFKCLSCDSISNKCDTVVDIGLSFPEEFSNSNRMTSRSTQTRSCSNNSAKMTKSNELHLEDMIEKYFQSESLEGSNQYYCEKCASLQNAERTVRLLQVPHYLIFHLHRFSYNLKTHSRSKICANVNYPLIIKIPSTNGNESIENIYCLYSIVMHSGLTSYCGHYYTYGRRLFNKSSKVDPSCFDANSDIFENNWFSFNDSNISSSSYKTLGNVTHRFPRDTAYLLFYQKVDLDLKINMADLKNISIDSKLMSRILQDNEKLNWEEKEAKKSNTDKNSFFTSKVHSWKDFDEDGNAPSGGSNCGLGNVDLSVSRFVF